MASPRIVPTDILGGIAGKDGSNVLPTDTAIKNAIQDSTSQTAVALSASITAAIAAASGSIQTRARTLLSTLRGTMTETLPGASYGAAVGGGYPPDPTVTGAALLAGKGRIRGALVKTGTDWSGSNTSWRDAAIKSGGRQITYAEGGAYFIEFAFTEAAFSVQRIQAGVGATSFDVWADDIYLGHHGGTATSNGESYLVPVNLPDARPRNIRILIASDGWFLGIKCTSAASVSYPTAGPAGARTVFVSDSFGEGGSATQYVKSMVPQVSAMTGNLNIENSSAGGTGYLADSSGVRVKLSTRLAADVLARNPNRVIVALGFNDGAFTDTQIANEAAADWNAIRNYASKPELIVIGPWDTATGSAFTRHAQIDAALSARALTEGVTYISPIQEGWANQDQALITGNAQADGTHPNDKGYEVLDSFIAAHLVA